MQAIAQIERQRGDTVDRLRLDMMGRGFALVPTPAVFDADTPPRQNFGTVVLHARSKGWWKFPQLSAYTRTLERLLSHALPAESLGLVNLELRHEPAGEEDKTVDSLHVDGSYLRSVCTLYGPATIYREGDVEHSVPCGQTLLMTAMDRARAMRIRCTLHRRPGGGPERAVIVCSFEPGT